MSTSLSRETLEALEALQRLHSRYHTINDEETLAAQRRLLIGTDVQPSLGFEFLVAAQEAAAAAAAAAVPVETVPPPPPQDDAPPQ